jgi:hypothetical protein
MKTLMLHCDCYTSDATVFSQVGRQRKEDWYLVLPWEKETGNKTAFSLIQ